MAAHSLGCDPLLGRVSDHLSHALLQVHQGVVSIGGTGSLVLRIDFNALPVALSWVLEEMADNADDAAAAQGAGQAPVRHTTHESDLLKRIDIYACT